jgi:hypothetical protein
VTDGLPCRELTRWANSGHRVAVSTPSSHPRLCPSTKWTTPRQSRHWSAADASKLYDH